MSNEPRLHTKQHNTQLILRTLYHQGYLSRADLARATGLTRPTISSLVSELMDQSLVTEIGLGQSTGGKRPVMLTVPEDAYHLLCIDIGNQAFRGALVNLRGKIVQRETLSARRLQGDAAIESIYQLIDTLSKSAADAKQPLLGIGIGTPGLIDRHAGVVRYSGNLDWTNVPLRDLLADRYDAPIYMANDSHLSAKAEFVFGAGLAQKNLIVIKAGQGIGAGIIWDSELVEGDSFGAGEIGQIVVSSDSDGRQSLEQVVGTHAILRRANRLSSAEIENWDQLLTSPVLPQVVSETGYYFGVAIASIIATLNIKNIFLSGRISELGQPLLDSIEAAACEHVLPSMVADTTIQFSKLGTDIVFLGCSALIMKREVGIF